MANDLDHGQQRAGLITASVAKVIMRGSQAAWGTLIHNLWSDDGSDFASTTGGARQFGHDNEPIGRALFWERHPELQVAECPFTPFSRRGFAKDHIYRRALGCSPDGIAVRTLNTRTMRRYGIEIKSPVDEGVFTSYAAYCSRHLVPPEHVDQVSFSLWITGWDGWHFVTHHDQKYAETFVAISDPAYIAWVKRFRPRLDAFLELYKTGRQPERDKLASASLASLIARTR